MKSLEVAERNFQVRQKALDKLEEKCVQKSNALDEKEANLIQRESTLKARELSLENELVLERNQAEQEILTYKQTKLDELSDLLSKERQNHSAALTKQFQNEEQHYLEEYRKAIKTLKDAFEQERLTLIKNLSDDEKKRLADVEAREKLVAQKEDEQDRRDKDLKRDKRRLEIREKSLNDLQENLDAAVKERYGERMDELQSQLSANEVSYNQLLNKLDDLRRENEQFKAVKATFGDAPFEVMNKELDDLRTENKQLKDRILALPPESTAAELNAKKAEYKKLETELENLRRNNLNLRESAARSENLEMQLRIANIEPPTA